MSPAAELADIFTQDDATAHQASPLERAGNDEVAFLIRPRFRYLAGFPLPDMPDAAEDLETIEPVEGGSWERRFVSPAVWTMASPSTDTFRALQRWEGVVLECRDESFLARLTDLTEEGPAEEVELPLSDVPREDLDLVELGAVFYWSIGYRDEVGGGRWRSSTLRFRRLPLWSKQELEAAAERAADIARVFGEG
jgi:hypothetical protein